MTARRSSTPCISALPTSGGSRWARASGVRLSWGRQRATRSSKARLAARPAESGVKNGPKPGDATRSNTVVLPPSSIGAASNHSTASSGSANTAFTSRRLPAPSRRFIASTCSCDTPTPAAPRLAGFRRRAPARGGLRYRSSGPRSERGARAATTRTGRGHPQA